ncbi:hypothetical protein ACJX0J_013525, partial [Zea mays]
MLMLVLITIMSFYLSNQMAGWGVWLTLVVCAFRILSYNSSLVTNLLSTHGMREERVPIFRIRGALFRMLDEIRFSISSISTTLIILQKKKNLQILKLLAVTGYFLKHLILVLSD